MRSRWAKIGFSVFVIAWIVALTYSVTAGGRSPERLDDPTARAVESNCRTAQRELSQLPQVGAHATSADTGARLVSEDQILSRMVDRQTALQPTHNTPAVALKDWLADWKRLIVARSHYASDLETKGRAARFIEPAYKGVDPIADKMNTWILEQGTRTNTCNTDALQAEVVNGPRTYGSSK